MREEIKGWISSYGTQMVPGSALDSAKRLNPVTISAVAIYAIDQNATNTTEETAAESLMDKFLQMNTKSGF